MKIERYMKLLCAIMVLLLSIGSACISAVLLSSETLNVDSTVSNTQTQENVLQKQNIAQESDSINEKLNNFRIKTERTIVNSEDATKIDSSEQAGVQLEEYTPKTETQLPQYIELEKIQHGQESSGEHSSEFNNVVSNVPMAPAAITVDDVSKDILVEAPMVGDVENILKDDKNDSSALQPQTISSTIQNTDDNAEPRQSNSLPETIEIDGFKTEPNINNATVEKGELRTEEENQIPVFSEWAQKRLEEVEKEVEQEAVNTSTMKKNTPTTNKQPVLKLKNSKNYASPDCGAKIIAANSESSGTGYVLTSTRDEYLLSPCKSRIWFIVELCEAIQAERIDLANFELFSSSPKNFSVGVSSRFPTRDWSNVGKFIAKDERYIQTFDLYPHLFGKYVRVDVHSHYNSEHFCPISLFRVYGTSEFEAFETENRQHPVIDDIDDDDEVVPESDAKSKTNIFKSASDAVMSLVDTVKKAASFVKPNENKTIHNGSQIVSNLHFSGDNCISPNHVVNCENCSDGMTSEIIALVQCKQNLLRRLLNINIIRDSIYKSRICSTLIGSDLNINCSEPSDVNSTTSKQLTDLQMNYIINLFSLKYITAMCNLLAAADRKIAWNSTIPINSLETPINVTIDRKAGIQLLPGEHQVKPKPALQILQTDPLQSGTTQVNSAENKLQMEQQPIITSESTEHSLEIESNESHNMENSEQTFSEHDMTELTTPLPAIESSEDINDSKNGQNIFNVAEISDTASAEPQDVLVEASTTTEAITEKITTNIEQETTPPNVIILPETTTQTPANDLNDASEEQANNGLTNSQQLGQKLHSESVFLRLSNRVKILELNMSLSGQYLEELSRRYKKQVEDLQMSFAKTLVNIEEQSRRNLERKQELFEQNQKLRNDLEILTERIFSWRNILLCCACFTCVQILIFYLILKIWGRKYGVKSSRSSTPLSSDISSIDTPTRKRKTGNIAPKFRRKSAEEKRERNQSESSTTNLQRRPSTEALNITGTYTELLIDDISPTRNSTLNVDHHQLRKGDKSTHYSNNKIISSDSHEADISGYVKIQDLKEMYDKPEDEYEFYGPAPELKKRSDSQADDCASETTVDSSVDSITSHPKKTKLVRNKNRRLSSPSFFKSPFSSGSTAQSTGWEWHRSKKAHNSSQISKKLKSESPPLIEQNGTTNNNNSNNNKSIENQNSTRNDSTQSSISSSIDDRKTSGSFKRILKKIF